MKHYEQPIIRLLILTAQDVLSASNPEWQDDPFTSFTKESIGGDE